MEILRAIFNFCAEIFRYPVNLLGYRVSLLEIVVFVFIGVLLFRFVRFFWG